MKNLKFLVPVLCASAMAAGQSYSQAADPGAGDDWQFDAGVYLWGAGIQADAASGSEIDIGFDQLINNLNMAFMGNFEARKSKWLFASDVLYLNVGVDGGGTVPVTPGALPLATVNVDAHVKLRAWVLSFAGGYNLWQTEHGTLDVIAGARNLQITVTLDASEQIRRLNEFQRGGPLKKRTEFTTAGLDGSNEESGSGIVWDAIIGVKGDFKLNQNWYVPYYLDIGAGDSDFTWQVATGVGYKFNWGDVNLVYRYMDWDFSSGSELDDLNLSGPQLGARFHF